MGSPSLALALGGGTAPSGPSWASDCPRPLLKPQAPPRPQVCGTVTLCTGKERHSAQIPGPARGPPFRPRPAPSWGRASRSPRVLPVPPLGECERGLCVWSPTPGAVGTEQAWACLGAAAPPWQLHADSRSGVEESPHQDHPSPRLQTPLTGTGSTRFPFFNFKHTCNLRKEDLLHLRTLPSDPDRPAEEGLGGKKFPLSDQSRAKRRQRRETVPGRVCCGFLTMKCGGRHHGETRVRGSMWLGLEPWQLSRR